jgi:hypothetical protein
MDESHKIMKESGRNSFSQGEQFKSNDDGSVTTRTPGHGKDGAFTETSKKMERHLKSKPLPPMAAGTHKNSMTQVSREIWSNIKLALMVPILRQQKVQTKK